MAWKSAPPGGVTSAVSDTGTDSAAGPDEDTSAAPGRRSRARLSREEERLLAEASQRGDRAARDQLIEANLPLVVSIARRYEGHGLPLDDLVGEGCVGLVMAAERYDPMMGTRFGTYATFWIKKEVRLAIRSKVPMVRVPEHLFGVLARWERHEQRLRRLGGPEPTPEQVARSMGLTAEQRRRLDLAQAARVPLRVEGLDVGQTTNPIDHRHEPAHDVVVAAEERATVHDCVAALPRRERKLLTLRFGLAGGVALTLKEVGAKLGLTRHETRNLERSALASAGARLVRMDPGKAAVAGPKVMRIAERRQPRRATRARTARGRR